MIICGFLCCLAVCVRCAYEGLPVLFFKMCPFEELTAIEFPFCKHGIEMNFSLVSINGQYGSKACRGNGSQWKPLGTKVHWH